MRVLAVVLLLALAACSDAPTPRALAEVQSVQPGSTAGDPIQPTVTRPIVTRQGNIVQCAAEPGGGAGGECLQP